MVRKEDVWRGQKSRTTKRRLAEAGEGGEYFSMVKQLGK